MKYTVVVLVLFGFSSLSFVLGIWQGANLANASVRPCKPQIRTVYVDRVHRADDVNAMLVKAGRLCRGDGGVGTVLLFPAQPDNWETLCAWGHETFTDGGLRL
jgi:hypothetical protein